MFSDKSLALLLTFIAASAHAEPAPPTVTTARADAPTPTSASQAGSTAAAPSAAPTGGTTAPANSSAPPGPATNPPTAPTPLAPSAPPALPAPAAPPPPSAPPAAPGTPPISSPAQPAALPAAGAARVRFAVNYSDAWLETRPFGVEDSWRRVCKAPCGEWVSVEGTELRVTAQGMTPSGPFRVDRGAGGPALLTVKGGSSVARTLGRLGFVIGVPVSLIGMTGFAYGHFDERRGLETAGAITLGVGAALVLTALPLLVTGSTSVRNEKGDLIASEPRSTAL